MTPDETKRLKSLGFNARTPRSTLMARILELEDATAVLTNQVVTLLELAKTENQK